MFLRLSQARPEPNASESGRHNHIRETFSRGSRHKRSKGKRPTPMFLTICATNHVGAECPNRRDRASHTAAAVRAATHARLHDSHDSHDSNLKQFAAASSRSESCKKSSPIHDSTVARLTLAPALRSGASARCHRHRAGQLRRACGPRGALAAPHPRCQLASNAITRRSRQRPASGLSQHQNSPRHKPGLLDAFTLLDAPENVLRPAECF